MFKKRDKIKMWSVVINQIPVDRLEDWTWRFTVLGIVITLLGGVLGSVCGWIAFEMNDAVTKRKESEMQRQIAEAKAAALPKPFKVRLITFLDSLDKRIMPALAAGQTKFSGQFTPAQFADIQRYSSETDAAPYITFRAAAIIGIGSAGPFNSGEFDLNPELLKP